MLRWVQINLIQGCRAKYLTQIKSLQIKRITMPYFFSSTHYKTITQPAFLAATLALICLVIATEMLEDQNLFWGPLHDSAHTYAAFLVSWVLLLLFSSAENNDHEGRRNTKATSSIVILGATFLIGIAIEIIQPFFNRSASFLDIYYNFVGVCCAGATYALSRQKGKLKARFIAAYIGIALVLASSLLLPALGAYTLRIQEKSLPQLLDFESAWQQRVWRSGGQSHTSLIKAPRGWEENSSTALQVTFNPGQYPGFNFAHPPKDWTGYSKLRFEVFSKTEKLQRISLRIHDGEHSQEYTDRFNKSFEIRQGVNSLEIPLSEIQNAPQLRKMNLSNVAGFAIFMVNPEDSPSLYFDNLSLF